jgi:L-ascorbate metabolism protein UlaG (beta-lactamase superfamily)
MLEIGAYNTLWDDVHMGPENAIQACLDVKGNLLLPLHWGTFALAFHPWTEPIERLLLPQKRRAFPCWCRHRAKHVLYQTAPT